MARHRTASDEIEGRILAAALELLDEAGIEALTVRAIAARASIAPMGIYSRYENKMGVYAALWMDGFERLDATLAEANEGGDSRARLLACGMAYRQFALHNVALYRLMFLDSAREFEPNSSEALVAAHSLQILVSHLELAQAEGWLRAGRPHDLAQVFWSGVHGYVALELTGLAIASEPDATFATLLTALLRGLAPD